MPYCIVSILSVEVPVTCNTERLIMLIFCKILSLKEKKKYWEESMKPSGKMVTFEFIVDRIKESRKKHVALAHSKYLSTSQFAKGC